jgi:hypothetical protein
MPIKGALTVEVFGDCRSRRGQNYTTKNRREHFPAVEILASHPRADLGVVGLCDQRSAVRGPEVLKFEDDFLEGGLHHLRFPISDCAGDYN